MWLTYIAIDAPAAELNHDLAIDASGFGTPIRAPPGTRAPGPDPVAGASGPCWRRSPRRVRLR